jgi:hypothetical protein
MCTFFNEKNLIINEIKNNKEISLYYYKNKKEEMIYSEYYYFSIKKLNN